MEIQNSSLLQVHLKRGSTFARALRKPELIFLFDLCEDDLFKLHHVFKSISGFVEEQECFTWPGPSPGGGWWPATSSSGRGRHLEQNSCFKT